MLENGDDEQNSDGMTKWRTVDEHVGHLNYISLVPCIIVVKYQNLFILIYISKRITFNCLHILHEVTISPPGRRFPP